VHAAHAGLPARTATAEERLEKLAEIPQVLGGGAASAAAASAKLVLGILPTRRRAEILPGLPVGAQLIVATTLPGILQHLVGFRDFLEARFGPGILVHVGMVFPR